MPLRLGSHVLVALPHHACRLHRMRLQSWTWTSACSSCHGTRKPSTEHSSSAHQAKQPATAAFCSTTCCRAQQHLFWRLGLALARPQGRLGQLGAHSQVQQHHILLHTRGACWSSWQGERGWCLWLGGGGGVERTLLGKACKMLTRGWTRAGGWGQPWPAIGQAGSAGGSQPGAATPHPFAHPGCLLEQLAR
jgi:hypothetical protein